MVTCAFRRALIHHENGVVEGVAMCLGVQICSELEGVHGFHEAALKLT